MRGRKTTRSLASLANEVPAGDRWLHEIKWDGYRLHVRIDVALKHAWVAVLGENVEHSCTRRAPRPILGPHLLRRPLLSGIMNLVPTGPAVH
jgi:hypothetical protein